MPLVHSGGWALKRHIGSTNLLDAVGTYPLLCCQRWSGLLDDIRELRDHGFVSFTAVIDPFCPTGEEFLRACFPDKLVRFKKHYIADLRGDIDQNLSPHHKRSLKASLKRTEVEEVTAAESYANEWITLYEELCAYRDITGGFALFSRPALAAQLALPGALVLRGFNENGVTAMQIWLHDGDHAYFHLGASNQSGYDDKAAFALTWHALHKLKQKGVHLADLGGTSGEEDSDKSGSRRDGQLMRCPRGSPELSCRQNDIPRCHQGLKATIFLSIEKDPEHPLSENRGNYLGCERVRAHHVEHPPCARDWRGSCHCL